MKIRMYNVGFGDCFCLRNRMNNLLVDFGTSNSRIGGRPRRDIFDVIISDLSTISHKNLLLTHFHLDHLSGLLYMLKYRSSSYDFGKIYLPDVFSKSEMSSTLAVLLLADLAKDSCLPSRQVSLFALVEALRKKPQNIELLSRGKCFEEKYQTLWPDHSVIEKETRALIDELGESHAEIMEKLIGFAEKLRRVVWSMTAEGRTGLEAGNTSEDEEAVVEYGKSDINKMDEEFRDIRNSVDFVQLLATLEEKQMELRQFKHKISVVFQNVEDGEWNLLFTGDVQSDHMKMIADNFDCQIPLFDHYWCVKVPHHGTQTHYFDFSAYTPENLLISNGVYYSSSRKKEKAYRISAQYGGLFYIGDSHMYCSNNDCCEGFCNGCSCKECDIIAPRFYQDI